MKYIKVRHSKRQILSLGVSLLISAFACFFILKSWYLPMIIIGIILIILLIFYIDYIVYTINVEYNQITIKRLFSNKTYYLDSIEYILSSPLSQKRKYQIDNSINKNKFQYTIHFENGKVKYDDNMDNSAEFLKILLKYSYVDRPLSR